MHLFQAVKALVYFAGEQLLFFAKVTLDEPQRTELAIELVGQQEGGVLDVASVAIADGGGVARDSAEFTSAATEQEGAGQKIKEDQRFWKSKTPVLKSGGLRDQAFAAPALLTRLARRLWTRAALFL